jgi:putative restriction endonuclease
MRVLVSKGVNGNGIVGKLFWDFSGKQIGLPMLKGEYPHGGFVEWHRREVFRG